ncbi:MAG: alpha/beta fold hydrolase [Dehalococcoidia bacterium]|nr:alpha/beta fold hydrolase [Dehalococcoidia bacterium]
MATQTGVQDKYADLAGMRFHYREWGSAGAPPLLLLHGVTGHARQWDRFAGEMVDRFHILALDQRGHGETEWGKSYTPTAFDEDIRTFVTALGLAPVAIVGQSLGGRIGTAFAALHPELIARLVIGDIGPDVVSAPGGARTAAVIAAAQDAGFDDPEEPIAASQKANPRVSPGEIRYSVLSNLVQRPDGRWGWRYDAAGLPSRFDELPSEESQWQQLTKIECPVLLVRGAESDILSAATASRMVEMMANCRLAVLPESGHGVPRDNPAAFLAAVRPFLLDEA